MKAKAIEKCLREGKITKRQANKMMEHSDHHSLKHIKAMLNYLENGDSFTVAHKKAQAEHGA